MLFYRETANAYARACYRHLSVRLQTDGQTDVDSKTVRMHSQSHGKKRHYVKKLLGEHRNSIFHAYEEKPSVISLLFVTMLYVGSLSRHNQFCQTLFLLPRQFFGERTPKIGC